MTTDAFGYMEVGRCFNCSNPRHLFAWSGSSLTSERVQCAECWVRVANHFDIEEPNLPTAETFPILGEPHDNCDTCQQMFVDGDSRWSRREAVLADQETSVIVHIGCIVNDDCEDCSHVYASTRYRNFSRSDSEHYRIPTHLFAGGFSRINGSNYCEPCGEAYMDSYGGSSEFGYCNACESSVLSDDMRYYDGEHYCDSCYNDNVYDCSNCGDLRWSGDDHDCDEDDALIHDHSYRPSPFFFGTGKYHFGFELEVESRGRGRYDGATIVQNAMGAHAYLKEDGSLNDGFEIVTHPHTLDKYQTEFDWSVLSRLQNEGYRSWNTSTCGLHVHVSRTAFGDGNPWEYGANRAEVSRRILKRQSHELRFMKLIYDNQRQVERIAGRSSSRFASFSDKGNLVRKVKDGEQENGRYSAINTENDDTIEVRVFKGSLRKERVLSAVEFVHASVEYTRDVKITSSNHALSWIKFTGYVAANAGMYPNLVTIMSESFAGDTHPDETI
jgi:hypothetical protein